VSIGEVPRLGAPTPLVHASYLTAVSEYLGEGGYPDFVDLDIADPASFAAYTAGLVADPRRKPGDDWPPMTLLWWRLGPVYLGRISIWHRAQGPAARSGHIGYDIRPSARGQGHATAMLRAAALPEIARLSINPARATVRSGNVASRRVLEANGAQLVGRDGTRVLYHLPTNALAQSS
jgi:predicted acetyltransferase